MKTDELQLFYPDFVPNQVLTNTQLNQLRTYLDEQSRLSRIRLVGRGIACGLTWRAESAGGTARRVVVYEGYGISSDGYLVELYAGEGAAPPAQPLAYTGVRPYTDPYVDEEGAPQYAHWQQLADPAQQIDLQELVLESVMGTEDAPDDAEPLVQTDLDGHVLVLYVEANEQELKSCLVTDCDNKGLNVHLRVRVLLVDEAALETWDPCGTPLTTRIDVPRLHAALRDAPAAPHTLAEVDAADEIDAGYGRIVKAVRDEIRTLLDDAYDAYGTFLDLDEDAKDDARATLGALLADGVADADFTQYHYDFVRDVAAACNTFVRAACDLVADCCPEYDFPRHLMLGALDGTEGYRHTFVPSPVRNVTHSDLERIRGLFRRILVLVDAFDDGVFSEAGFVHVTPSRTDEHPLGSRAVPYYYGFEDDVQAEWQPRGCCTTEALWSYFAGMGGDGAPTHLFDTAYAAVSLFRIEGHLHGARETIVAALTDQREENNLEFDILPLQLTDPEAASDEAVEEMLGLVDEIEAKQLTFRIRQMMDLVEPVTDWYEEAAAVEAFRESVAEQKQDLYDRNRGWAEARAALGTRCSIDHLQADYLLLRSEFLADYKRIHRYLTALLDYLQRLPEILLDDLPAYVDARDTLREAADFAAHIEELRAREEALQEELDGTEDPAERDRLQQELDDVREELEDYEQADETVQSWERFLGELRGALGDADGFEPTPLLALTVGLVIEVANLRDHVHELIHYLLPPDLRDFNYRLFDRKHGALVRASLEHLLLPVFILLYVVAFDNREGLPEPEQEEGPEFDFPGDVLGELLANAPLDQETADYLGRLLRALGGAWHLMKLYDGAHHNRWHTRFATVYHALAHLDAAHVFGAFADRNPGLEHLAGVEKGGTFVLVCDGDEVVADFALRGRVPCCCDFDPDDLCLPPVAVPDFHFVVRPVEEDAATAEIDVLRNDYDLWGDAAEGTYDDEHASSLVLELDDEESEQGFPIELVESDDGPRVRYTNDDQDFYGLDGFRYRLVDERSGEECTATGHVVLLVVPGFVPAPEEETGALEGTVTVGEEPVGGVDVDATGETNETRTAATGDDGVYRFDVLPGGTYTVSVTDNRFEPFSAEGIVVSADETTTRDIQLRPVQQQPTTGRLEGTVFGANGQTLAGVAVGIVTEAGDTRSTQSGANGRYVFDAVAAGTYTVVANAVNHQPFSQEGVEVRAGTVTSFDIDMQGVVIGVVGTDSPMVMMRVETEDVSVAEAEAQVRETYEARYGERFAALDLVAEDPAVAASDAYAATRDFMVEVMNDPDLTGDALDDAYETVRTTLAEGAETTATDEERERYATLLEAATGQYLDRYTLEQPADVPADASDRFAAVFEEMRDAGVDMDGFATRYKAGDVGTEATSQIESLMRNVS